MLHRFSLEVNLNATSNATMNRAPPQRRNRRSIDAVDVTGAALSAPRQTSMWRGAVFRTQPGAAAG